MILVNRLEPRIELHFTCGRYNKTPSEYPRLPSAALLTEDLMTDVNISKVRWDLTAFVLMSLGPHVPVRKMCVCVMLTEDVHPISCRSVRLAQTFHDAHMHGWNMLPLGHFGCC